MRVVFLVAAFVSIFSVMFGSKANAADSRAQELLRQARAALGGEEALNAVHSLSISGSLRRLDERQQRTGETQISLLLPDKFKKVETMNLIADVEITFTATINGEQFWTDSNSSGGGNVRFRSRTINQDGAQAQSGRGQQLRMEFARHLASLMLTSSPAFPVDFIYKGEAQSKDGRADVFEAKGPNGFSTLLFLDKSTHRPLMMKYRAIIPRTTINTSTREAGSQEEADKLIKDAQAGKLGGGRGAAREVGDWEVYFSNYRSVNGVMLPHKIKKSVNGSPWEEWDIDKYKVNPSLTARDFEKK
jgi:hypothetical protein